MVLYRLNTKDTRGALITCTITGALRQQVAANCKINAEGGNLFGAVAYPLGESAENLQQHGAGV